MLWNLRMRAAERGIWKSSEMRRALAEAGLEISAGKMSMLWTSTPTTVRLQRTDGVTSDTGAIADATYRGGYVLLGKVGGADGVARFQNLTIT